MIGNMINNFVQQRMKLLDLFLTKVAGITHLYNSEEFQLFIRGPSDFRKASESLEKDNVVEASRRFQNHFAEFAMYPNNDYWKIEFEECLTFFRSGRDLMQKFEVVVKKNFDYFDSFRKESTAIVHLVNNLSEYFSAFGIKEVSITPKENFSNPYCVLLDWTRSEILDLLAIIEAIEKQYELEKHLSKSEEKLSKFNTKLEKAKTGKKTFSQYFSSKTKEQLVEEIGKAISREKEVISAYQNLIKIIKARLINLELPRFKQQKVDKLEMVMRTYISSSKTEFETLISQLQQIDQGFN
uniref:Uncharacterized protein n=1 Tax=Fabrea salina TaxID=342563 RepID=A0A7S3IA72_9CILI|mmetsp:Transcript_468/g.793  ORF Transcript_468/g.793 Transcript_468/m.793 type:complete len:297 (+) Transcript_468:276-1166(+)